MDVIRYSARVEGTKVLGPGNRAVLWVHGCCFDCPGCIGHHYKEGEWLEASPQELADWYLGTGADGLTISGGEPMLQAAGLARMVGLIRELTDCGVIVYSGFTHEALLERAREDQGIAELLGAIDLLIDGRYVEELNDGRPYVGSSNQRIIALTDRYQEDVRTYYGEATARKMEIRLSETGTLMVGVPSREQAEIWQQVKRLGEGNGV